METITIIHINDGANIVASDTSTWFDCQPSYKIMFGNEVEMHMTRERFIDLIDAVEAASKCKEGGGNGAREPKAGGAKG